MSVVTEDSHWLQLRLCSCAAVPCTRARRLLPPRSPPRARAAARLTRQPLPTTATAGVYGIPPIALALGASYLQRLLAGHGEMAVRRGGAGRAAACCRRCRLLLPLLLLSCCLLLPLVLLQRCPSGPAPPLRRPSAPPSLPPSQALAKSAGFFVRVPYGRPGQAVSEAGAGSACPLPPGPLACKAASSRTLAAALHESSVSLCTRRASRSLPACLTCAAPGVGGDAARQRARRAAAVGLRHLRVPGRCSARCACCAVLRTLCPLRRAVLLRACSSLCCPPLPPAALSLLACPPSPVASPPAPLLLSSCSLCCSQGG